MALVFQLKNLRMNLIPSSPGIYFFLDHKGKILYIGKAANLRKRLSSYFLKEVSEKVFWLKQEAKKLQILPLNSEIEALIKEAAFIKSYRPKYNILFRDDKNYFFVVFSKETFPRIFITHQINRQKNRKLKISEILGPYVDGRALKITLRLIRKIFPYCSCKKPHARTCLQNQLGLCPGYCCKKNSNPTFSQIKLYAKNIRNIKQILAGKSTKLQKELEKNLKRAAEKMQFEEAAKIRDQLKGLSKILEHRGIIQNESKRKIKSILKLPQRIECYDASVLSAKNAVGAMTVFVNGKAETSGWRLFKMRYQGRPNDPKQIQEMIERRLLHLEWPLPNLIIVDGGIPQLKAAQQAIKKANLKIPVIAIAKGKKKQERIVQDSPPIVKSLAEIPEELANTLRRIRDATHRFSINYHRRLRKKELFGKS